MLQGRPCTPAAPLRDHARRELLAELYQVTVAAISQHIGKIFEERELAPEATVKQFLTVRTEGNRSISRTVDHDSLPVVLAVGYRVRSARGTQFRRWATTDWVAKLVAHGRRYALRALTVRDAVSRYVLAMRAMTRTRTEDVRPVFEELFVFRSTAAR